MSGHYFSPAASTETPHVCLWVGVAASKQRLQDFFRERYSQEDEDEDDWEAETSDLELEIDEPEAEEEEPWLSEFAESQGVWSYGHDCLEVSMVESVGQDLRAHLEPHSFSASYIDQAAEAYAQDPGPVNVAVLYFGDRFRVPRGIAVEGIELRFLGSFAYDRSGSSVVQERMAHSPETVRLDLLTSGALLVDGLPAPHVTVDSRGLVLGTGGSAGEAPYLDLSGLPGAEVLASAQVRIHRDEFDQWVIEDLAGNDLTRVCQVHYNHEYTHPWHKNTLNLGPVSFLWNCFPEMESAVKFLW